MHINIKKLKDHDILAGIITTLIMLIMLIIINICSFAVPVGFNHILYIGSIITIILLIVVIIVQLLEKHTKNKL